METAEDADHPLVSVVIPCYNHASFLAEAVESAINQSHPHVEIVVVDDGSTDNTAEVARRYPEVHYIRQANRGLSAARNAGIRESRGDYLIFLDADDRLLPAAVESGLASFHEHPESAFVWGSFRWIDAGGRVLGVPNPISVDADAYGALLRGSCISMHAAVMFRRDPMESIGGYRTDLRACEDYDVYLRIAKLQPVHQHTETVAEYRMHDRNMSGDSDVMLSAALTVLGAQRKYAKREKASREAYEAGVRFWIDNYGREREAPAGTPHTWKKAARRKILVMRAVPHWFAKHTARRMLRRGFAVARPALPARLRSRAEKKWPFLIEHEIPLVGRVRFGDFRHTAPMDRYFGYSRGLPVDRYYIEDFLERHAGDVRGCVLEIKDNSYTRRFGAERVTRNEILDLDESNAMATIVADLTRADHVASDSFDCILLTQTLQLIYDVPAALATVHRILKPGGVVLATVPGITKVAQGAPWYWSFTRDSAVRLFEKAFPGGLVQVEEYGNVLAATAFLQGLAVEELRTDELDARDADYPVTIAVRARKPGGIR